jgi:glycosyltransferase involved in cell wall biosynthesis
MTQPTVSIVMTTFNRPALLREALLHLSCQDYPSELLELLVVDDGGESPMVPHRLSFPFNVTILRKERGGIASARNLGIRKSRGDIVIVLDDDLLTTPSLVSAHVKMQTRHDGAIVKGNVQPAYGTTLLCTMMSRENFFHRHGVRLSNFAAGSNISVKRKHLLDVGLYDEGFKSYGWEGTELNWRLISLLGLHMRFSVNALAYHKNPLDFEKAAGNLFESGKSMVRMARLHPELMVHREAEEIKGQILSRLQQAKAFKPPTRETAARMRSRVDQAEEKFRESPDERNRSALLRTYTRVLSWAFREGVFQALRGFQAHETALCRTNYGTPAIIAHPLEWRAFFASLDGYGQSARNYVSALRDLGCPVRTDHIYLPRDIDLSLYGDSTIFGDWTGRSRRFPFLVNQCHPDQYRKPAGQFSIGFTAHETTEFPAEWLPYVDMMDELWAPSSFVREAMLRSGLKKPIHVIPHGVDCDIFYPHLPRGIMELSSRFVFLTMGSFYLFKGFDVLIRAYLQEFAPEEGTLLVLRTALPPHALRWPGFIGECIDAMTREAGVMRPAPILLMEEPLSQGALADLINSGDAMVSASRGEGFGLALMEAMACQKPVIATAFGGALDYLNDENSFLLDYRPVPALSTPNPFRMPVRKAHREGTWAEPSESSLRKAMRRIFEGGKEVEMRASRAFRDIRSRWTTAHAAVKIMARLGEL